MATLYLILSFCVFASVGALSDCKGCERKGVCHPAGSTYEENCFTYKCFYDVDDDGAVSSGFVLDTAGCKHEGECFPVGYIYEDDDKCSKRQCMVNSNGNPGFRSGFQIISFGCKDFNGACVSDRGVFKVGCVDYICEVERHGNNVSSKVRPTVRQCKSFEDKCIAPGSDEVFRAEIRGKVYDNCRCHDEGNRPTIKCGGSANNPLPVVI